MLTDKKYIKLCKILDNASYIYYNHEDKVVIPDSDFDKAERMCEEYEKKYPDKVNEYSRSLNINSKDQYDIDKLDYIYDFYKLSGKKIDMSKEDYLDYIKNNMI